MTELDHTEPISTVPAARADTGQFVVPPGRPSGSRPPSRWATIGACIALGIAALTTWGLVGEAARTTEPVPPAAPPAETAPPAPASATMVIVDVTSGEAALDALARLAGWGGCPVWRAFDVAATILPATVESAIQVSGAGPGFLDVRDASRTLERIWVGGDVEAAARAFGGAFLVREPTAAWTVIPWHQGQAAVRLKPIARRDGGVFWQITGRAAPAPYCVDRGHGVDAPVRVLHVAGDAREGVFQAAGFGGCLTWSFETTPTAPSSAVIERAAAAALVLPDGTGWIDLPADAVGGGRPLSAWLGRDERGSRGRARVHPDGHRRRRAGRRLAAGDARRSPGRDRAPAGREQGRLGGLDPDPQRVGDDPSGRRLRGRLRLMHRTMRS